MHRLIRQELDNLAIQFPGKSQINLDEYSELYGVKRKDAAHHLRRRGIPATKEGRSLYISMTDLATYKAQKKLGNNPLIPGFRDGVAKEMENRRGFNQMAANRQISI